MAWGLSGGRSGLQYPPSEGGQCYLPHFHQEHSCPQPTRVSKDSVGVRSLHPSYKKTPNVPRSALAGGAWTSATLLPPGNRTGPPPIPVKEVFCHHVGMVLFIRAFG